jgi:hypothetical protein
MLHDFLEANRADLIDRCRARVVQRHSPELFALETEHGMPLFLGQLIDRLRAGILPESKPPSAGSNAPSEGEAGTEMGVTATRHGRELMARGFTVEQVVRDYGDLCQEITGLVIERGATIEVEDFRTLNRCLDDAIADAVTEFAYQRDLLNTDRGIGSLNERLGFLAHELRNLLQQAMYAIDVIKRGKAGLSGATGAVLDRSLVAMSNLIDRTLGEVRSTAGMPPRRQIISLADFISDAKISASLAADIAGCQLTVSVIDPSLAVEADRDMLFSAVGNLLQNAFKFTRLGTEVKLNAYAEGKRILISVEDSCGGLPPGDAERMFLPFTQNSSDKSGVGLGLAICRRCTEANNGTVSVRNLPAFGCVFTMDLPRKSLSRPD